MKRLSSIALCFALLSCVENPEERTAFRRASDQLRQVLPGEIARLSGATSGREPNRGQRAYQASMSTRAQCTAQPEPGRNLQAGISFLD